MMTYSELVQKLFQLHTTQRGSLHLETIHKLCEAFNSPQIKLRCIHVAGSNGKGSVTNMITRGLQSAGYNVGMFTSPHLFSFRERIQINGEKISEESSIEYLSRIFTVCEKQNIDASFFEITTLLAFLYFQDYHVDFAVIETGLGGRYDATNVILPVLSVITSISLEHTELLGSTLEEIAFEKAGIIKYATPVVLGPHVPLPVFVEEASKKSAPIYYVAQQELLTDYRIDNALIAKEALRVLGVDLVCLDDLLSFIPPCRFEVHSSLTTCPIVFDVGHNPDGLTKLCHLLKRYFPERKIHAVIAISSSKDLEECIKALEPVVSYWYPTEALNGRSYPTESLEKELLRINAPYVASHNNPFEATQKALANASHDDNALLLVCGSFFIMADARKACGIKDDCDAIELNERKMPLEGVHTLETTLLVTKTP